MKLQELKQKALACFNELMMYGIVSTQAFAQFTQQYGLDRRRKDSWRVIYADLYARTLYETYDDPALLLSLLNNPPLPVGSDVFDRFVQLPDGYQFVVDALNQVYFTPNLPTCEKLYGLPQLSELLERARAKRRNLIPAA